MRLGFHEQFEILINFFERVLILNCYEKETTSCQIYPLLRMHVIQVTVIDGNDFILFMFKFSTGKWVKKHIN